MKECDKSGTSLSRIGEELVAVKILVKDQIKQTLRGSRALLDEIRVHWALEQCQGVLKLLKIYEDANVVRLVLEYQPKGTLMEILEKDKKFS